MRRAIFAFAIAILFTFTSCITGDNVFSAESSSAMLINALTSGPSARTEERPIEEVLAPPDVMETAAEEPEPVPDAADEDITVPAAAVADSKDYAGEPAVIFIPAVVEPVVIPEEALQDDAGVQAVAESAAASYSAEGADNAPQIVYVEREDELVHYSVDDWMLRLMIVSIVSVILFTAATALRSGVKRMLSRLVSLLLAVLFTAVPWIITVAIAGFSPFWCIYAVLLLTYFIFRSENQRRGVR